MTLDTTKMLDLLKQLVNIDSGTYDCEGVGQVGQVLIEKYKQLGFEVTEYTNNAYDNKPLGNHFRLRHKDAKNPKLLILAHLDTVFEKGTVASRPFSIKDNRAYGPGVIDMKGSHVLVYFALEHLIKQGYTIHHNIEILLNSDEEIGSPSSKSLIEATTKGKSYALVMEPARSNGNIVSARRGVGKYYLNIKGVAAHSGIAPKEGASAIEELALLIPALHALSKHDEGVSVNVGLISGGSSVNTVAAHASAQIDLRLLTQEQGLLVDKQIREICAKPKDPRCHIELTGGINRPPMIKTEGSLFIIDIVKSHAASLGITLDDILTGGGSDASFTSAVGVPTLDGLGPVGGHQHTELEYLEIDSLVPRAELFMKTLISLNNSL